MQRLYETYGLQSAYDISQWKKLGHNPTLVVGDWIEATVKMRVPMVGSM